MIHFDDRLRSIARMAQDTSVPVQAVVFRQVVDLFLQRRLAPSDPARDEAIELLEQARQRTPRAVRLEIARMIARHGPLDVDLVAVLADDDADIAAPLLMAADMPETAWLLMINRLPEGARSVLASRQDLPAVVRRALGSLGGGMIRLGAADHAVVAASALPQENEQAIVAEVEAWPDADDVDGDDILVSVPPEPLSATLDVEQDGGCDTLAATAATADAADATPAVASRPRTLGATFETFDDLDALYGDRASVDQAFWRKAIAADLRRAQNELDAAARESLWADRGIPDLTDSEDDVEDQADEAVAPESSAPSEDDAVLVPLVERAASGDAPQDAPETRFGSAAERLFGAELGTSAFEMREEAPMARGPDLFAEQTSDEAEEPEPVADAEGQPAPPYAASAEDEEDLEVVRDHQVRRLIDRIVSYQNRHARAVAEPTTAEDAGGVGDNVIPWRRAAAAAQEDSTTMAAQPVADARPDPVAEVLVETASDDAQAVEPEEVALLRQQRSMLANETAALRDIVFASVDWCWQTNSWGDLQFVEALNPDVATDGLNGLIQTPLVNWLPEGFARDRVQRAMERRVPFRGITVAISDRPAEGVWSVAAVPLFDQSSGVFEGYRGTCSAVDPAIAEVAAAHGSGTGNGSLAAAARDVDSKEGRSAPVITADVLFNVAHEVRSPLNAIIGFAEMIASETMGHVAPAYRDQAGEILESGDRLLKTVDEFLEAARLNRAGKNLISSLNPAAFLGKVVDVLQDHARRRQVYLVSRIGMGLPRMWTDESGLQRVLTRLVVLATAASERGDTVIVGVHPGRNDDVRFTVSRPQALAGGTDDLMASIDQADDGTATGLELRPAIGTGFSMRLIAQMARSLGGRLEIEPTVMTLCLPAVTPEARAGMANDAQTGATDPDRPPQGPQDPIGEAADPDAAPAPSGAAGTSR